MKSTKNSALRNNKIDKEMEYRIKLCVCVCDKTDQNKLV